MRKLARGGAVKKVMLCLLVLVLGVVTGGCAVKQLTRDEYLALNEDTQKAMFREYEGKSKEDIISACEKTLKYSDEKYIITQHVENGFYASRRWLIYMIIAAAGGDNHWKVTVEETEKGVKIEARAWLGEGITIAPLPVPIAGKNENEYYRSPSLYDLFFARVDYFLGLRQDWVTCSSAEKNMHRFELGMGSGLDALCSVVRSTDPTVPTETKEGSAL